MFGRYLRECVAGLRSRNDQDSLEVSLRVLEKIVRSQPDDLHDTSLTLITILLHLENEVIILCIALTWTVFAG